LRVYEPITRTLPGQQQIDAFFQRIQRRAQHIRAAAVEQFLGCQQGMQLIRTEPQTRQFELLALQAVVEKTLIAVAQQRRMQHIAQKGDVSVQGGPRAAQLLFQGLAGNRETRVFQALVQGENTFVTVHRGGSRRCCFSIA
jgi:hypothetical protein